MLSTASKRLGALAGALVLLTAACKGEAGRPLSAPRITLPTTSTTAAVPATTVASPATAPPGAPLPAGTKVVLTATDVVAPVVAINDDGTVAIRTPCENVVTVHNARPVGPVDVLIDPGHGGDESGAIGVNGLPERNLNLAVSRRVVDSLRANNVPALLTRTGDYRLTLTERANIAHAVNPKALVSVHHNGGSDGPRQGPGSEVFYQHASAHSRRLAGLIYEEIVAALSQYQVAWQADTDAGAKTRLNDSGGDYYAMVRQPAPVVSVLAELAFLSNPPEAELLARADVQAVESDAVARGILRYLRTADPGSGYIDAYPRTEPAGGGGGQRGCVDPPLE